MSDNKPILFRYTSATDEILLSFSKRISKRRFELLKQIIDLMEDAIVEPERLSTAELLKNAGKGQPPDLGDEPDDRETEPTTNPKDQ